MKLERWMIEAIVLAGILLTGWGLWLHHDETQQKIGADKIIAADAAGVKRQREADEALIAAGEAKHAQELATVAQAYASAPHPHVVCHAVPSSPVPATGGGPSESGPTDHGQVSDDVHPDITPALWVFAYRLDEANASLRRMNSECANAAH